MLEAGDLKVDRSYEGCCLHGAHYICWRSSRGHHSEMLRVFAVLLLSLLTMGSAVANAGDRSATIKAGGRPAGRSEDGKTDKDSKNLRMDHDRPGGVWMPVQNLLRQAHRNCDRSNHPLRWPRDVLSTRCRRSVGS